MSLFEGLEHVVRENEPLAPLNWFRLGGPAEYFAEPTSEDELARLVRRCREEDLPVRLLGGGSNVLIRDEGLPGLVISLAAPAFSEIAVQGNQVRAGGGAKLGHLISSAVREGLAGLEQLVGIPGTVGGALHGNAGIQNADIGQWTEQATVMTRHGEIYVRQRDELQFSYRKSSLDELVVLSALFTLAPEDSREVTKRMQKQWIVKRARQPQGDVSAGRIFKSSGGMAAAELIDQAGLKSTRVGQAAVSDQHANFILAHPGCTSQDVLRLIDLIRGQVHERLGVELETEIEIW